jgi:hypothetical protein
MNVQEFKFLLELLGFAEYRAPLKQIKPNPKTKARERNAICRALADRELVAYCEEVLEFSLAPAGKSLLQLDTAKLPIADEELAVLQACAEGRNPPPENLNEAKRQEVLRALVEKGLIQAEKTQIQEVWLTPRGVEYLRDECNPRGSNPVLNFNMLHNYLRFLRQEFKRETIAAEAPETPAAAQPAAAPAPESLPESSLQDEDILRTIEALDREWGTDNYLPIFHLRQKLQPPLSREELDRALYRLQRSDRIELSSLQEAIAYSPEEIEAGIPQDIGGPLFFIIVTHPAKLSR